MGADNDTTGGGEPIVYLVEAGARRKGESPDTWWSLGLRGSSPWRYPTRGAFEQALPSVAAALATGRLGSGAHREGTAVFTLEADPEKMARMLPDLRLAERLTAVPGEGPIEAVRLRVSCGPQTPEAQTVQANYEAQQRRGFER